VPGLSNASPLNKLKGVKLNPPHPVTPKLAKPFRSTLPATFKATTAETTSPKSSFSTDTI
jgi:hypothetical protein